MSTAQHNLVPPPRARSERLGTRWERTLAVLCICLPIPVLAATGLSIPLPAGVERIAALLVAWVDESDDASLLGDSGAIVLAGSEQAAPEGAENADPAVRSA